MRKKDEYALIRITPETHARTVAYCKENGLIIGKFVAKLIERELPQAFKDQFNASKTPNTQA
jgi:hypothetical protein